MYIIFINNNQPTDRKRFTLCHALGHIIMHNYSVSSQIENEADRFAGEFLMPANEIRHQLINLDIPKLANLKRYWGVSMAALIMRAKHLEVISDYEETQLWKRMSARGYRLSEPFEPSIKDEAPELLKKIISLYKTQLHYSDQQLEDFLFLHPDDREKYSLERTILRLVPNSFTEK
jgi:Zn-dependent peptidase ImmA (M78 family)